MTNWIEDLTVDLVQALSRLDEEERVDALNAVRRALHEVSPFRDQPIDLVEWARVESIVANDYNPNTVAPPEMQLLERSIVADGYTQPIVTHFESEELRVVVDGFHRNRVGRECHEVATALRGRLPVTRLRASQASVEDRMASTIRHNRARGTHGVDPMTVIVGYMGKKGWDSNKIGKELGMELDEVLRYRQISGLAELFQNQAFSEAWDMVDSEG